MFTLLKQVLRGEKGKLTQVVARGKILGITFNIEERLDIKFSGSYFLKVRKLFR